MALIEDTEETMVRTDLWNTMTLEQLARQQDLMITKISTIAQLVGANTNPSILVMYNAMKLGMSDLNKLIETKATKGTW